VSGLPYGWWKDPDFWVPVILLLMLIIMTLILIAAWFFDWQGV
jgi:hypothetical protein